MKENGKSGNPWWIPLFFLILFIGMCGDCYWRATDKAYREMEPRLKIGPGVRLIFRLDGFSAVSSPSPVLPKSSDLVPTYNTIILKTEEFTYSSQTLYSF